MGAGHDVLRGLVCLEVVGSAAGVVCRAWGVAQSFVGRVSVSVDLSRCCFNQVSCFLCRIWQYRQV